MRDFFTTAEATTNNFLFISYSHDDQEIVKTWTDYMIDQGVRIWWDKAFMGGDDWETIAQELLSHENCVGFLFFASKSAIASPQVAKEWRAASKTKKGRSPADFYAQIIMAANDAEIDYKYLTNFVKKTEDLFSDDDYDDFRDLFGKKDHLYYCAQQESDKAALLQTIKNRVPQAVDEQAVIRDKLADICNHGKEWVLSLGAYGDDRKPITWHQIHQSETEATLLCRDILAQELGGVTAEGWLSQLLKQAFSADEQAKLQGNLRFLTREEAMEVDPAELATGTPWWLADCDGNLQAVVREDGTVYQNGYNNRLYKKGIRPVITLDITTLYSLAKK